MKLNKILPADTNDTLRPIDENAESPGRDRKSHERITSVLRKSVHHLKHLMASSTQKPTNDWWHREENVEQIKTNAEIDTKYKRLRQNSRIKLRFMKAGSELTTLKGLIHPESSFRLSWDFWVMLLVVYIALTTPIELAFTKSPFNILGLEVVINLFFVLDIILNFRTSFRHTSGTKVGRIESSHTVIATRYLKTWFILDLLASFPLDFILLWANAGGDIPDANKVLRILRGVKFFRVFRVDRIYNRIMAKTNFGASIARLSKLFTILFLEWHILGCIYWGISEHEWKQAKEYTPDMYEEWLNADPEDIWVMHDNVMQMSIGRQYIRTLLWAITATTGIGKDIKPKSDIQFVFTTVTIMFGVMTYALVTGSLASVLQNIDTVEGRRRQEITQITEYLRQRNCDDNLVRKISTYYEYCHDRHLTACDENLLSEMHSCLKEDLDLSLNRKLLKSIPRFEDISSVCILELINAMNSRIYIPQEVIYLRMELAKEVFFVARGDLEALDGSGERELVISDGSFFGNEVFQRHGRRKSTIRSVSHSELLILSKGSLKKIIKKQPEFAFIITDWGLLTDLDSHHSWRKIQHTIHAFNCLKDDLGSHVSFEEFYDNISRENVPEEDGSFEMVTGALDTFKRKVSTMFKREEMRKTTVDIGFRDFRRDILRRKSIAQQKKTSTGE